MNGIYYVANDRVLDWFLASIKSVRAKGATLPVRVIPYNREISKIAKFARQLDFEIWEDPKLEELDALAKQFVTNPRGLGMYRKFACFWGPFENFLFADVDIIALLNWDELVMTFVETDDEFWFFASSGHGVYRPGPFLDELLRENRTNQINTGMWVTRRGLFDLASLWEFAKRAEPVQEEFASVGEQAFLNFCIDFKPVGARMASERVPRLRPFNWAGSQFMDFSDYYTLADRDGTWRGKRFSCIHWAGYQLGPDMPYADLFLKYRLADVSAIERARFMWNWKRMS